MTVKRVEPANIEPVTYDGDGDNRGGGYCHRHGFNSATLSSRFFSLRLLHLISLLLLLLPSSPNSTAASLLLRHMLPHRFSDHFPPELSPILSSDIHTALRLLNSISFSTIATASLPHRLAGLLTNHYILMSDSSLSISIHRAANFMATIREPWPDRKDNLLEEAAICAVLTNAVEVQDSTGRGLGIAIYDPRFSWINHSCSPNACYSFIISPSSSNTKSYQDDLNYPKTIPHITNSETSSNLEFRTLSLLEQLQANVGYGPKVTARSIKKINNAEEITVSYIDLLQPSRLRQSDLWSKYRFMCNCGRCAASPQAYVDSLLEGVLTSVLEEPTVVDHHGTSNKDEAVGKMTDHIQNAIDDFLSDNIDPKTCCEIIENVLDQGIHIKSDSTPQHMWLHPSHHIALNAYITLATAYRIRSSDSQTDMEKTFDMRRTSVAYSFFLAGASHNLFSVEPSLGICAANFWKNAGESLLDMAWTFSTEYCGESDVKCSKCLMLETPNSNRDIKEKSRQILSCVTDISQVVWSFLTRGHTYLQKFRSPFDFSFTRSTEGRQKSSEDQKASVLLLSFHCLLYADLLSDLCYGPKSHLVS